MAKDTTPKPPAPKAAARPTLSFTRTNGIWLGLGTLVIVAGYALLARGDTGVAPVLLVIGYCVLVPIGIVKK